MSKIKPFQICPEESSELQGAENLSIGKRMNPTSLTHSEKAKAALYQNEFINSLFLNPKLSGKAKRIITKELKNYVGD